MITLNLNGKDHQLDVTEDMPLLWAIRDVVGYTGTKFGCGMGLCGSCTIHIDGQATRSCITPVSLAQGRKVTTIDHLHTDKVGEVVQQAWLDIGVARTPWPPRRRPSAPTPCPMAGWTTRRST